ncbi:MAG: Gfo/Idh/MocA family oxidoreductase [Desulfomicrobium escambiense]|nr:Gfo/Idh/MocA family oxidoreductase [Desulfomicrobium escambiense]
MSGPKTLSRRRFLRSSIAAAASAAVPSAAMIVPRRVLGRGPTPPSDTLGIAGIGIGGMGAANLKALEEESIVALCDVDPGYAAATVKRYPKARFYTDYRALLDKEKGVDAVVIATPDHTHAVITMAALRAGKHVYTQKPLTHDVWEARQLTLAAQASKLTTQMGIQGHSGEGIRLVVEWVRAGLIGEVREVDAWCDLSYYPWGHAYWSSKWGERPADTPVLPSGLAWDLWIGPAPFRPYHPAYHPMVWRCWWDFGVGMMGDRGAHTLDAALWALGPRRARNDRGHEPGPQSGDAPAFGRRHLSLSRPRRPAAGQADLVRRDAGAPSRGPRGRPEDAGGGRPRLQRHEGARHVRRLRRFAPPRPRVPDARRETARAVDPADRGLARAGLGPGLQEREKAGAAFEYAGPLTEICLLGNVAKKLDTRIAWDAANLRVTNVPEAEALIRRPCRPGWNL